MGISLSALAIAGGALGAVYSSSFGEPSVTLNLKELSWLHGVRIELQRPAPPAIRIQMRQVRTIDRVSSTQAAVTTQKVVSTQEHKIESKPAQVSEAERTKLRSMHRALRGRFLAAVSAPKADRVLAKAEPKQKAVVISPVTAAKAEKSQKPRVEVQSIIQSKPRPVPAAPAEPEVEVSLSAQDYQPALEVIEASHEALRSFEESSDEYSNRKVAEGLQERKVSRFESKALSEEPTAEVKAELTVVAKPEVQPTLDEVPEPASSERTGGALVAMAPQSSPSASDVSTHSLPATPARAETAAIAETAPEPLVLERQSELPRVSREVAADLDIQERPEIEYSLKSFIQEPPAEKAPPSVQPPIKEEPNTVLALNTQYRRSEVTQSILPDYALRPQPRKPRPRTPQTQPEPKRADGGELARSAQGRDGEFERNDEAPINPPAPPEPVKTVSTKNFLSTTQASVERCTDEGFGKSLTANAVEFFRSEPIEGARLSALSAEGSACKQEKTWVLGEAAGFWRGLSWMPFQSEPTLAAEMPLLSHNAARMLAALLRVPLYEEAGVVLGRLPAGLRVEFSGRSEKAVYLNDDLLRLDAEASQEERLFAFINAEPGAHVLHLIDSATGNKVSGVALPVLNETSTYVDLRKVRDVSITGRILDALAFGAEGISNAQVQLVGFESSSQVSNSSGRFSIPGLRLYSDLPLYLEVRTPEGFVHRYQVKSNRLLGLNLFHFDSSVIAGMLRQLEGGVSPESGIAIGAAPGLRAREKGQLLPSVRSIEARSSLVPEAYSLDGADHLLVEQSLSVESPRYLSVQLPEGLNVLGLQSEKGETLSSELLMSSPGVVNVVGPY